jgi:hypothetical protein
MECEKQGHEKYLWYYILGVGVKYIFTDIKHWHPTMARYSDIWKLKENISMP